MQSNLSIQRIIMLLLVFLIYSSANIFMKLAASSGRDILSIALYFSCAIGVLGIYACLWQKVLKHIPLATAFMFKSITVLYGMMFAFLFFGEVITINNIIGASLIIAGIIVLGWK